MDVYRAGGWMFLGVVGVSMYAIPQQSRPMILWYSSCEPDHCYIPNERGWVKNEHKKNFNNNLTFIPD